MGKPLFIPLKTEFFEAFEKGEKDTEYRRLDARWNERSCFVGRKVVISKGYGKASRLTGQVVEFRIDSNIAQTNQDWVKCYGPESATAACIKIKVDR